MEGIGLQIAFYSLAGITVGSALLAATAPKIVHSVFALMATFFGVAGIYGVLGSDFLAVTQVVVYVGGILVLLVFGVLLTDRVPDEYRVVEKRNYLPALTAGGLAFAALAWAIMSTEWPAHVRKAVPDEEIVSSIDAIGVSMLTDYLIPFEFASILLLIVLVGAARVARGGTR